VVVDNFVEKKFNKKYFYIYILKRFYIFAEIKTIKK